jgi:hypothetical protein
MGIQKKEINIKKLRSIFEAEPLKKREVQVALGFDRQTMSKILNHARKIDGAELLTIAEVCRINPADLAV